MRQIVKRLVGPTVACALGLFVGFSFGQRQGFKMGLGFLETEVKGTLSMHVEAASCVRVGDTARALALLDQTIDTAVLSLVAQPAWQHWRATLSQARSYRDVVPATGPVASEVRTALQSVPAMVLPPEQGSPPSRSGLVRLVRQAGS